MADRHDRLRDDVAAYATGLLDPIEQSWTKTHLGRCGECRQALRDYRGVLGLLPRALPREGPEPGGLAGLLSEARRRRPLSPEPHGSLRPREAGWRGPWRVRAIGWIAATACAGLLGWNIALQRELLDRPAPVPVEHLARLPDGRMVALIGTGVPGATARIYVTKDGTRGELAIAGLPALPAGRVYQLWFGRPGASPLSGGVFHVDARGEGLAVVAIPVALEPMEAIAVTEEPAPGSAAPTGPHLLDRRI
jgi:anti-sigma-K factor RskA